MTQLTKLMTSSIHEICRIALRWNTHTHMYTLEHYTVAQIIVIFPCINLTVLFPQNSFDAGNADLTVHDPHAIAGTTYTTIT